MEKKTFNFELKELRDDGTFEGYAAIFRKGTDSDLGKDRIERGAFKKTLEEGKYFPLHWYHNIADPVGEMTGEEDRTGLKIEGRLILEVQRAKELYALMRKTKSVAKQLSIGYEAMKWTVEDDIRVLKEIKLYEVSIVTYGMDQGAFITDVKMEGKPYENEHACRLQNPDKYDRFTRGKRKHEGKEYSIIFGWHKVEGEEVSEEQAYRYDKDVWSADEARAHCKSHDGSFEAAKKSIEGILGEIILWKDSCCIYLTDEQRELATQAVESLNALSDRREPPSGTPQGEEPQDKNNEPENIHPLASFNDELLKLNQILTEVTK